MPNNERMTELMQTLENGVREVFSTDRYQEWLNVQSRFHHYSFNNTILILMQKPDATQVAGYKTWKNKFNRQVRKGEKGISILAPMMYKKTKDNGDEVTVLGGFKYVNVFDVSQTEGDDLPSITNKITTEDHSDILQYLQNYAASKQLNLKTYTTGKRGNGYYNHVENEIGLLDTLALDHKVKTLAHELAHYHTWSEDQPYAEGEMVAESVAYVVCQHIGLDTSDYTFGYVAAWSGKEENVDRLKDVAQQVQKTASILIQAIETEQKKTTKKTA